MYFLISIECMVNVIEGFRYRGCPGWMFIKQNRLNSQSSHTRTRICCFRHFTVICKFCIGQKKMTFIYLLFFSARSHQTCMKIDGETAQISRAETFLVFMHVGYVP